LLCTRHCQPFFEPGLSAKLKDLGQPSCSQHMTNGQRYPIGHLMRSLHCPFLMRLDRLEDDLI
jgi:hypothetical protein